MGQDAINDAEGDEILDRLAAFKAGDAGPCTRRTRRMARLMGCVFAHQLNLDEGVA
ncbi:MAG: hypothetical protein M3P85_11085 [Actinomycetota bacterium]|nr:hypothetical protein [Actinomycetota bacterium]